jgi:hypothetical protein
MKLVRPRSPERSRPNEILVEFSWLDQSFGTRLVKTFPIEVSVEKIGDMSP